MSAKELREKEIEQLVSTGMTSEEAIEFLNYWDNVDDMVQSSNRIAA